MDKVIKYAVYLQNLYDQQVISRDTFLFLLGRGTLMGDYLPRDGSKPMTGNLDFTGLKDIDIDGKFRIRTSGQTGIDIMLLLRSGRLDILNYMGTSWKGFNAGVCYYEGCHPLTTTGIELCGKVGRVWDGVWQETCVLKEITTPTADADYGKVYTKNDNKLYFQDGAGVEHEIALVP